jgi:hypothetical protein
MLVDFNNTPLVTRSNILVNNMCIRNGKGTIFLCVSVIIQKEVCSGHPALMLSLY